MKKIRITAAALAALTALAVCGCDTKKEGYNESEEGDVLKVYMIGAEKPGTKDVISEANKILKEKIGAELEWTLISAGGFQQKMNMVYASNENFDVCFTGYCNKIASAVDNGCLLAIDDLLDEYAPTLKKDIPEYLWKAATIDKKIYAVPNQQINAVSGALQIFKSDEKKYGIKDFDKITTAAELEKYFDKIKKTDPNKWVYRSSGALPLKDKGLPDYETLSSGIAIEKGSKDCKVVNLYKTDTFADV